MKKIHRRDFLKTVCAGCCGLLLDETITPLASRLAHASAVCGSTNNRVLLHIIQSGGNDAANTLVPRNQSLFPKYFSVRPSLAITNSLSISGTADYGLHPSLTNFQQLYNQGILAMIPKVGYPHQSNSHADATRNFAKARFDGVQDSTGWAGRIADTLVECGQSTDFALVSFGGALRDIAALNYTAITTESLSGLAEVDDTYRTWDKTMKAKSLSDLEALEGTLSLAQREFVSARNKFRNSTVTLKAANDGYNPSGYPTTSLGYRLKDFARLIKYGVSGLKYVVVPQGGYDTHDHQLSTHATLMSDLDAAVAALVADLQSMGKFSQVTIMIDSEFSRCLHQNDGDGTASSSGTDHGSATLTTFIGPAIHGGIYGPGYSNTDFNAESFVYAVDVRELRARVVDWLGVDPAIVFPESYPNGGVAASILPSI